MRNLLSKLKDVSAAKPGAKRAKFDVRQILAPVGLALLLSLSALFLFQTWQAWSSESLQSEADRVVAQARQSIGGFVSERQRQLSAALLHPEIARYFASGSSGDATRALAAIKETMPEVSDGRFIGADVLDEIGEDIGGFGYANAEMLLSAARLGAPAPAQVHGVRGGPRELVLVNPVNSGGSIVGFALIKLPYEPLRTSFQQISTGGLQLALLQGEVGNSGVLEGNGEAVANTAAVPGAMLRIGYRIPPPLIVLGPEGALGNLIAAIISAFASILVIIWRTRPELLERLLHPSRASAPGEVTLEERLRVEAAARESKAAATSKAAEAAAVVGQIEVVDAPPVQTAAVADKARKPAPSKSGVLDSSIFRAYDIRGVVGKTLTTAIARQIGHAVGSEVRARGLQTVLVGRDGRLSGPEMADAVIQGLLAAGCDVIDIGAVPTPVLYFATHDLSAGSGIMVTGSHNPPDYNGFKIMIGGDTLAEQDIQALYDRIVDDRLESGRGALTQMDLVENYIERISGDIQLESPLKVVIDCGNGIAGGIAPRLFEEIGCEVMPLYCEVDGHFPNHHPDPSDPRNLEDLIITVRQLKADIGLAFDGDGDRLGVVTAAGKIIYPDRLLMLFARDVLTRAPGATIIYDVKCTGHLSGVILGHGGSPVMWKTGHSLIKKKMKETQAELAGEMSGHFFFKERWYGFDDGLYAGCRLLEIIAADGRDPEEIFAELPQGVSTPELKIEMQEGAHYRFMEKFRERAKFDGARVTLIDGVRADWADGWGLVRCSNTTPCLVLRFDAADGDALARIQGLFRAQLLALDAKLVLPF
ncbi:MAG: phosphomannomutase/phosphoglucomutase [Lysobacterales bacterium]